MWKDNIIKELEEQYELLDKLHNTLKTKKKAPAEYLEQVKKLKPRNK